MRCPRHPSFTTWFPIRLTLVVLWLVGPAWVHAKERDQDIPLSAILESVQPDLFTGALTAAIPIDVPPGRQGVQPNLQLAYESAGGNGWAGMGWKLDLGAIERSTRFGVNYAGNDYTFRLSGISTALVQLPAPAASTDYGAKVEGGFTRVRKLAAPDGRPYWEATDTKGKRYRFGYTSESRLADPADPNRIFRWCLDRVEDADGNYLTVTYWPDQGQAYLSQIDYTGNGSILPTNTVKFYLETRPDAPDMYTTNFRVRTAYRLKTIEVRATNNNVVRTYTLTYTMTGNTSRSLLSTIRQFGKDGTALPAIAFTWPPDYERGTFTESPAWDWCARPVKLGDFNGDGKTDYVCDYNSKEGDGTNLKYVAFSNGNGTFTQGPGWDWCARPVKLGDFNGDGKTDYVCDYNSKEGDGTNLKYVAFSNGNGTFTQSPAWDWCARPVKLGDFNGDGKTDYVCDYNGKEGDGTNLKYVAFSNGNGTFTESPAWDWCARPVKLGDFNGDGKTDYVCDYNGKEGDGTNLKYVAFSNGNGTFTESPAWDWCARPVKLGDFNGDGKTDYVCDYNSKEGDGTNLKYIAFSNGNGLFTQGPAWDWCGKSVQLGDFNGDGRTDYVCDYNTKAGDANNLKYVAFSKDDGTLSQMPAWDWCSRALDLGDFNGDGKTDYLCNYNGKQDDPHNLKYPAFSDGPPLLLTNVTNGLGATTTMHFVPSTLYSNTQLPFPVHTVNFITTNDGNSNVGTTYSTTMVAFITSASGISAAFNYAKMTGPPGPNGEQTITETWFHQGNDTEVDVNNPYASVGYVMGKPYRTRVSDGQGHLYSESTTRYTPDIDGMAPYFTPPLQVDTSICDGTACGKQTRVVSTYDGYGNLTQEEQYGDLDNPIDDRTIARSFVPNTLDWIVSLPANETIYQGLGAGTPLASTEFYYDGVTDCGGPSTNQMPTRGHVTRVVRWLAGGLSPETRMAYDGVGNPVCARDANGHTSTLTYDSSATFPTVVTNALGQQTTTQYYGVGGVPADTGLYAQVKRVTDPNGAVVTTEYDALGRKTKVTTPDGFWTTMTYQSLGTVGAQHVRTDNALGLSTWTYVDGLGRPIRQKRTGPDAKVIVTDTQYNARGAVRRTSLPYFEVGGTALWRTLRYDPLGRLLEATQPDGSRTLRCEDDWVTVTIDANQHRKRETRDAYGRVSRIDEYQGTFETCDTSLGSPYATTAYEYDLMGGLRFVLDHKGNLTEMQYDTLGRKSFMHDPDMGNWTYAYDAAGNLTQQTDAKGQPIFFQYDPLNRRRQKDYGAPKPLGSGDVVYTYDQATSQGIGRLTSMADGSGSAVLYYDVTGRRIRTDKTVNNFIYITQSSYDGLGRVTAVGYPDGSVVHYTYNGPLLDHVADAMTTYARYSGSNALGQPATTTFGNGVVTTATYAHPGNATCSQPTFQLCTLKTTVGSTPAYQDRAYGYDAEGNVTAIADALHGAESFGYDELDRLTGANGPYGSHTFQYNEIGNLTYNPRLGSMVYPPSGWDSVHPHAVMQAGPHAISYDANGNLLDGAGYTAVYDPENRPISITSGGPTSPSSTGQILQLAFNESSGSMASDSSGNGHHGTLVNGPIFVPGRVANAASFDGVDDYAETNPSVGNFGTSDFSIAVWMRTTVNDQRIVGKRDVCDHGSFWNLGTQESGAAMLEINQSDSSNYRNVQGTRNLADGAFHHIAAVRRGAAIEVYADGTLEGSQTGSLVENLSNAAPLRVSGNPCGMFQGVVDELHVYNRALSPSEIASLAGGSTSPPAPPATTTSFVYDGDGARVKKVEGTKTSIYIGKLYVCEFDLCAKFIWAGSQRIAMKQVTSGSVTYFHTDHLGSTSVLTNAAGAVEQTLTYYPFGETQTTTGSANSAYKYTGKEQDQNGLYFYEARYYHPVLGRFITADTVVPNPRDPQELNRYTYAGNNPLKYTDPTGHLKVNFNKFLNRAFGDVGTTLVGIAVAAFTGCYTCGAAIMTQSESGRYTLAASIVATSAIASFYCGGCGATFTIAGLTAYAIPASATVGAIGVGTVGGISAAHAGGDISSGVLVGTAAGAAAGALNGYLGAAVNPGQFTWSGAFVGKAAAWGLLHMTGGAILNAASGAAIGYAGGRGNWDTILQAAGRSVVAGAKTNAATTLLGLAGIVSGPTDGFPVHWDVEPMGSLESLHHVHLFDVSKSMATSMEDFSKLFGGNAPQLNELQNDRLSEQLRRRK